jgi:hypothetical protein
VGVEATAAFAVEAAFHGGDRRLGQQVAGQLGEPVGDLLLGQAAAFADGFEVVGDDGVDVEAGRLGRLGRWPFAGAGHAGLLNRCCCC